MSHFGRAGPPDITDTYSLLVLNITFSGLFDHTFLHLSSCNSRFQLNLDIYYIYFFFLSAETSADDLFPLFDKYGKVVDIFIPRDRRTNESRGFAFVRYKYADEAQKAVDRLDGRTVDGREITVQFAKYGPNAERIHKGRIIESNSRGRSRSRSPRPRYRDVRSYRDRDYRRRSRSRSWDRYDCDRYRGRDDRHRGRSRSASPDYYRGRGRGRYDDRQSRSRSIDSVSPVRRSSSSLRSLSPHRSPSPRGASSDRRSRDRRSPTPLIVSPRGRAASGSRSPLSNSDV